MNDEPVALPDPPASRGAGFLVRVIGRHYIAEPEGVIVEEAARVLDLLDKLQDELRKSGPVVGGNVSPIVVELRQQRLLLGRLVSLLPREEPLPDAGAPPLSPKSQRAKHAADVRWRRFREIRGLA